MSRMGSCALLTLAVLAPLGAYAQDRLTLDGDVDVRWVHATGETSFLNGGLGLLRFDPDHDGVELGRAFLAPNWRVTDIVSVHAVLDTYGDDNRNPADVSECYLDLRPFPTGPVRWRVRTGAFFMPVSMENRGVGWSDVYSITPSAINTWMGEEFRTLGSEVEARWLGASSGYLGDVSLVAAAYGWNEPAGKLIWLRGWGLTDRPSTLFGTLGSPPIDFYHEYDHRPGFYGGLTWRHHDWLELRALRYDNDADPQAEDAAGHYAWRTRFTSLGARLEPDAHWTFIAQYLDGDTAAGESSPAEEEYEEYEEEPLRVLRFRSTFALASFEWGPERLTARFDDFHTHQVSGLMGPRNQDGHAWTLSWSREFAEHWQVATEWLRVASTFPPRVLLGESPQQVEMQFQIALRYRFDLGW
jgi:hypothetical protein